MPCFVLGTIAGHIVEHYEFSFIGGELSRKNIGVGDITLCDAIVFGNFESESSSFLPVEQTGKNRRRIEIGKTELFDISVLRNESCRSAVTYHSII